MSVLDFQNFGGGEADLDKAARRRKAARDERWRRGLAQRENWNEQQYEEERLRLEDEVRNWPNQKAA